MKLPFFSTSPSQSNSRNKKEHQNKKRSLSRPDHNPSFGSASSSYSSSSSSSSSPTTPTSVLPHPPFLGRNASCLDPEYCSNPNPNPNPRPLRLYPDGKIATSDLGAALARLGSSECGVADLLAKADPHGQGRVAFEDLLGEEEEEEEEELKVAFAVYDANGDGKISAEELHVVFRTIGDASCSLADCRRMIGRVDSDGDGQVCFRDFARMMSARSR